MSSTCSRRGVRWLYEEGAAKLNFEEGTGWGISWKLLGRAVEMIRSTFLAELFVGDMKDESIESEAGSRCYF